VATEEDEAASVEIAEAEKADEVITMGGEAAVVFEVIKVVEVVSRSSRKIETQVVKWCRTLWSQADQISFASL
jgi:hypothetical protein